MRNVFRMAGGGALVALLFTLVSCKEVVGPPGPPGSSGPQGPSGIGVPGPQGPVAPPVPAAPSFGNRAVADQSYHMDIVITPLQLPAATKGTAPLVYTLAPAVPGLRFDAGTRTLSGTPKVVGTYSMTYTVGDDYGGSGELNFTVTVLPPFKIYWISEGTTIERANLDGSERETVTDFDDYVSEIAIHDGKMYFMRWVGTWSTMERANLDGSGRETVVDNAPGYVLRAITILDDPQPRDDRSFDKVFFGAAYADPNVWDNTQKLFEVLKYRIERVNPDGSGRETLISLDPGNLLWDISIDDRTLFWIAAKYTLEETLIVSNYTIERINLDKTGRETLVDETPGDGGYWVPNSIVIHDGIMYILSSENADTKRIERINLDGSGREALIYGGDHFTNAIAIFDGKIYWNTEDAIVRANLDGSGRETVISHRLTSGIAIAPIETGELTE